MEINRLIDFEAIIQKDCCILFGASWSKQAMVQKEAADYDYYLDVEKLPQVSLKYQIMTVPTFIYFKEGNVIKRVVG